MILFLKNLYPNCAHPELVEGFPRALEENPSTSSYFAKATSDTSGRAHKIILGIGFKIIIIFLFIVSHISFGKLDSELMVFNTTDISDTVKEIVITFIIPEKDYIYKDFITCSVNEPTVTLSPWKASIQSINYYDASFKDTKQIFNENFSLTMIATTQKYDTEPVYLYCSYYRCSEKKINHIL